MVRTAGMKYHAAPMAFFSDLPAAPRSIPFNSNKINQPELGLATEESLAMPAGDTLNDWRRAIGRNLP
jgi:hypothetical protein